MIRYYLLCLLLFVACSYQANSQDILPTYSDYLTDNLYLLHPSMAGASNRNKIRMTARQQWFGVKDAPSLQTLSVHGRLQEKIGLGAIVFNDQNGNFSKRGLYGSFAYHLMFSRSNLDLNQLSFGLSLGLVQHSLNDTGFEAYDPLLAERDLTDYYASMDLGVSYYYFNYFIHLTAKNLLPVERELYYSDSFPSNQRQYYLSSGYLIETEKRYWSFEPSVLFLVKENPREMFVDLNLKAYREFERSMAFGGISYRAGLQSNSYGEDLKEQYRPHYITPFIGFEFGNFLIAYTYSQQLNSLVLNNSGFHQISLGYNFGESRQRYECFCPGVNQGRR